MNQRYDASKPMQVGGQAVIEGVMMRTQGTVATAVRRSDGEILVKKEAFRSLTEKYRWLNVPVLRGGVALIEMLVLGIQTLNYSAEVAMEDLRHEEEVKHAAGDGQQKSKQKTWTSQLTLFLTIVVALVLGIAIFFVTPLFVTTKLFNVEREALAFNVIAGAIRIVILLAYLMGISLMRDVRRIFQYHGAEHKSVFAFELNDELIVSNAKKYVTFHPRCGTSFILIVMFVAVLVFSLLDTGLIAILGRINLGIRLLFHLPFIPIIGGIAYEFIKLSAKKSSTRLGKIIVVPGLWLQKITTQEPDDRQLEVALVALRSALGMDEVIQVPAARTVGVQITQ